MNISKVLGLLIGTYLIQGLLGKYSRRILNAKKILAFNEATYVAAKRKPEKIQACWDSAILVQAR